jgi:tRNA(adenine34) deaminase
MTVSVKIMNETDSSYMREALNEAQKAYAAGEVPVGCVIVQGGKIIARGYNQRETTAHVFNHAEMMAIDEACKILHSWRLDDCTLYVTLEPCVMCAGTMIQARLPRLVYGAPEPKSGANGSIVDVFRHDYNHQVQIESGVLAAESSALLKAFFKAVRRVK